jgi:hypothetical protein
VPATERDDATLRCPGRRRRLRAHGLRRGTALLKILKWLLIEVYALIADPREWKRWSVWNRLAEKP